MDLALPPAPVLAELNGGSTFSPYLQGAPGRRDVEAFIGGCFAAMHGATIRRCMPTLLALTDWLMAGGSRWVVFTGARLLVNSFRRMGIPLTPLAPADPRRIEPDGTNWGTYYNANPWVMAIEVSAAFDALAARGAFADGAFARRYGFGGTGVAA